MFMYLLNRVRFILYSRSYCVCLIFVFFFKQKTAYEMRISDWSSDVCSSDLHLRAVLRASVDHPGAMYIRLGRGRDPEVYPEVPKSFRIGQIGRASCRERVWQ